MAGRRCDVLDVREMLRRLRLGESARAVAKGLGVSRNTVREYVAWFEAEKLMPGDATALPTAADLDERLARAEPVQPPPRLMPYHDEIADFLGAGLQVKVAWERFSASHPDVRASYTAFRRFVRRYVDERPRRAVVRLEVDPGDEAQVDFGYAGMISRALGEAPAKTWAFVMTLSHSRHQYVELVQDQTVGTWLFLHRNAFQFLGGVPRKVVLDNLKAGIIKASVTDPEVQRAYRECAEHYGFVISPCVARTPEHKGKVERGVQYVKRSFLAGRSFRSLIEANNEAIDWVVDHAGARVHGTTQEVPLQVFEAREKPALIPLPEVPFDLVEWKQAKLHPDCHVVFARSYYSAPHPFIGERLWLRATSRVVQAFREHKLVATHNRALRPGQRVTNSAHLPPKKLRYLMQTPTWCRERAAQIGPSTAAFIERLLGDEVLDRLRGAQATLRLADAKGVGAARLEAACRRAVACDAIAAKTVQRILNRGLDREPLPGDVAPPPPPRSAPAYARTFFDLFNPAAEATTQGEIQWTSSISSPRC
jgi:transposase